MVKINISSFLSSVPTSVAVLMGRDHVELAMAKMTLLLFTRHRLKLLVVGRILRWHEKFLFPGMYTLYNILPLCVDRTYEYDGIVTPLIILCYVIVKSIIAEKKREKGRQRETLLLVLKEHVRRGP